MYSFGDKILQALFSPLKRQAEEVEKLRAENAVKRTEVDRLREEKCEILLHTQQTSTKVDRNAAAIYAALARVNASRSGSSSECKPASE